MMHSNFQVSQQLYISGLQVQILYPRAMAVTLQIATTSWLELAIRLLGELFFSVEKRVSQLSMAGSFLVLTQLQIL